MKTPILTGAVALVLSGCAALAPEDPVTFAIRASELGVVFDGSLTRDEAPAYIQAAAETFGGNIPEVWLRTIQQSCVLVEIAETDLDAKAAAVCAGLAPFEEPKG